MSPSDDLTWMNVIVRVGLNAVTHPVEYAKVLIQIGHEPLTPYMSRTIFGKEKMFYPSIFQYIKHIKQTDGFLGCYRGLSAKLYGNIISGVAFAHVTDKIKLESIDENDPKNDEMTVQERTKRLIKVTMRDSAGRVCALIVSQPFHVIAIRTMAEFVGREGKYTALHSSVGVIYQEEGLRGFFSGLIPRILLDVGGLWLANIVIHLLNNYLVEDHDIKTYVRASVRFFTSTITYPLQVVSSCMAVNSSGMVAGQPPRMPHYESWTDCLRHLRANNASKRGSALFWRACPTPLVLGNGFRMPTQNMFIDSLPPKIA